MLMHEILDLDRYPLHAPASDGWGLLVEQCQHALACDGMFSLEGLLRQSIAEQSVEHLEPKFDGESFHHVRDHNIYFENNVPNLTEHHPALQRVRTSNYTLCGDVLLGEPVHRLYHWPKFATFLAAVMGKEILYTMEDELAGLNVMSYQQGQQLNWHFDRSEFTTTMLLQSPDSGGEFMYRSDLRTDAEPNYEGVAKLLRGEDNKVRKLTLSPGTLNVFKGKNTLHRVTPVQGPKSRVIAVFSFYEKTGVRFSEQERIGFYGRAS